MKRYTLSFLATEAPEPKSSYVRKADGQYWAGVGIYLKK
jgi:hypothetical protein